jgi:CheY-like chemotaxis protein
MRNPEHNPLPLSPLKTNHYTYSSRAAQPTGMTDSLRIVLCVDDDPDDREIVCRTIEELDSTIKVIHAGDGVEAIDYLSKVKNTHEQPCLVILDMNMPRMDGKQTLSKIKKDQELSDLNVVIFTTSNSPIDKTFCAQYGVELITKPDNVSTIKEQVRRLLQYCG